MFSSDIPFESMQATFGQVKAPLIMVHSGKDEYIPANINKERLMSNLSNASPSCLGAVVLPDADHAISDLASQTIFCNAVVQFIRKVIITLEQEEKAQEQALGGLSL